MSGVFTYANPGVIRWGAGSLQKLPTELERCHIGRPYLVSTRSVLANAELLGALEAALGERPLAGRCAVGQHAPAVDIEAAVAAVVESSADGLVSLGGGSPIDAAKLVALQVADGRERLLPHIALPTTLSVAELAAGAGFTDAEGNKVGRRDPRALPAAVIYDAELTLQTPLELWLSTGIRALDHAVETFLVDGEHPLADVLCVESMRRLFVSLPAARQRPNDLAIRTENQLAAWFSFTMPGPAAAGLSHMMGKQIGARFGIPHGVTSCLLLPHVLRYRARHQPERVAALPFDADAVQALIAELGLPQHLAAYGLGERELRAAAEGLNGLYPTDELLEVYLQAL